MHPAHYAVSYRASFKPELPAFFMNRYLKVRGSTVLDPFGGRGTTAFQANLMGHRAIHNDINPVAVFLGQARQKIAPLDRLVRRVESLDLSGECDLDPCEADRLLPFFHPQTLREILALRTILLESRFEDPELNYIGLTALSRLYGHSDGFFSVYTFPQISILPQRQRLNNERKGVAPQYRNVKERIIRKLERDVKDDLPETYHAASAHNHYLDCDARQIRWPDQSIDLIVTSPPFLDKVNYVQDNWMRAWFLNLEEVLSSRELSILEHPADWLKFMEAVMYEMLRLLRPGGRAIIEVGDVEYRKKPLNLEELLVSLLPLQSSWGKLQGKEVWINEQSFTKLANCWKVSNNARGTNTNRCLVLQKL